jgi:hypothetical protein
VRLQNAQAVFKLYVEGVFPAQIADVLDLRITPGPERGFGVLGGSFHNRPSSFSSRIKSRILHIDYYAKCGQARAEPHPMLVIIAGQADSLNVAMATVITLFVLSELFAK